MAACPTQEASERACFVQKSMSSMPASGQHRDPAFPVARGNGDMLHDGVTLQAMLRSITAPGLIHLQRPLQRKEQMTRLDIEVSQMQALVAVDADGQNSTHCACTW